MGIDHKLVEEKLPGIVAYADLGEFIDAPIKTYSSGMRARLGFAIATSVEPDILILDEVLSTGDAAFREKSKQRVGELVHEAKAIVLVTHDMNWVKEYCTRAMLLEKGRIVAEGTPDDVVAAAPGAVGRAPRAGRGARQGPRARPAAAKGGPLAPVPRAAAGRGQSRARAAPSRQRGHQPEGEHRPRARRASPAAAGPRPRPARRSAPAPPTAG